jgi:Domain of unknown function (DUF4333)
MGSRLAGLAFVGILGGVTMLAAGCGDEDTPEETPTVEETPTLDTAAVESALTKALDGTELLGVPGAITAPGAAPQPTTLGGGRLEVRSLSCPESIPEEQGGTFVCEVDAGKQDGSVRVTQKDATGERLSYKAKIKAPGVTTEIKGETKVR